MRLILLQAIALAILQLATVLLSEHREVKIALLLVVFVWISFYIGKYLFEKKTYFGREYFKVLVVTSGLFELAKFMMFLFGRLDRYTDAPFVIAFVLSVYAIAVYLGILQLLNRIKVVQRFYR